MCCVSCLAQTAAKITKVCTSHAARSFVRRLVHAARCVVHVPPCELPQFALSVQRPHATQAAASCCAVHCGVARLSAYCGYTVADRAVQGPHGAAANGRAQARQAEEGRPARPSWRRARDPWRLVPPQPSRTGYHVVRDTGRPPGATGCARLCTVRCRGSAMLCVLHVVVAFRMLHLACRMT